MRQSWTGSHDSTGEKVIDLMGVAIMPDADAQEKLNLLRRSYLDSGAVWISWISYSTGLARAGFYINYECGRDG